jgi:hypothetical protein
MRRGTGTDATDTCAYPPLTQATANLVVEAQAERIAELEAALRYMTIERDSLTEDRDDLIVVRDRAEAALAERDREVTHWGSVVRVQAAVLARVRKTWYPLPIDRWYRQEEEADLRARAEKGRES